MPGSPTRRCSSGPELLNHGMIETLDGLPEGVLNITARAGEMVVMNDLVTHGVLPWPPPRRPRA